MIKTTINNMLNSISSLLKIKETPNFGSVPPLLMLLSRNRNGMSAIRATNIVLEKKRELGIPTGNLSDGTANFDDILWYTAIKAIIDEITLHSKITTVTQPLQKIVASGSNGGGPVVVYGQTVENGIGGGIIE